MQYLKDLRVLWINDYSVKEVPFGGAELTDDSLLKVAKDRGLNIFFMPSKKVSINKLKLYDLVILSNNYNLNIAVRDKIIDTKKYICLCQDYGRWTTVLKKNIALFNNAILSVFMSPGHRLKFSNHIGDANTVCIPPHISKRFYNYNQKRNNRILYVGYLHEGKGIWNIIDFAERNELKDIDFYCFGDKPVLERKLKELKNCYLKGIVLVKDMPKKYNEYTSLISIPLIYESFSRVVMEAYACGCKLIINNKIGAFSYNCSKEELRERTLTSHFEFWDTIAKNINK